MIKAGMPMIGSQCLAVTCGLLDLFAGPDGLVRLVVRLLIPHGLLIDVFALRVECEHNLSII